MSTWGVPAGHRGHHCQRFTMANTGSVRTSAEVARQFEIWKPSQLPLLVFEPGEQPLRGARLDHEYELNGGPVWRALAPDSQRSLKWWPVQPFPPPNSNTTEYTICDHQGRPIGVWDRAWVPGSRGPCR